MKNSTESNSADLPSKEQVIETVIDIFVREIGIIERNKVSRTTDDLSWFAEAVVKHFHFDVTPKEWLTIKPTIEGIADFVLYHSR